MKRARNLAAAEEDAAVDNFERELRDWELKAHKTVAHVGHYYYTEGPPGPYPVVDGKPLYVEVPLDRFGGLNVAIRVDPAAAAASFHAFFEQPFSDAHVAMKKAFIAHKRADGYAEDPYYYDLFFLEAERNGTLGTTPAKRFVCRSFYYLGASRREDGTWTWEGAFN